jgi:hypothetical protein
VLSAFQHTALYVIEFQRVYVMQVARMSAPTYRWRATQVVCVCVCVGMIARRFADQARQLSHTQSRSRRMGPTTTALFPPAPPTVSMLLHTSCQAVQVASGCVGGKGGEGEQRGLESGRSRKVDWWAVHAKLFMTVNRSAGQCQAM